MQTAFFILLGIFMAVGVGCILAAVQRWLLKPRGMFRAAVVVPVFGGEEDLEYTLRSACDSLPHVSGRQPLLFIVDYGMDAEARSICELFCRDCPAARVCGGSELADLLRAAR